MKLFGKKKDIRFETITIERERDVFRALENKGWALCADPFQFDIQKSHEKLRKDAMKMAKELHAELLVEVWDPIYQRMHWKGLRYSAWRMATPEELIARRAKKSDRPDYSDSLGSYEAIHKKIDEKQIHISDEEIHSYDSILVAEESQMVGEVYGNADEDMGMKTEHIETIASYNPYDHQGEMQSDIKGDTIDRKAAQQGPMFEEGMTLEIGTPKIEDPTKEIDPLAMMMDAAPVQEDRTLPAEDPPPAPDPAPLPAEAPPPQVQVSPQTVPSLPVMRAPPPMPQIGQLPPVPQGQPAAPVQKIPDHEEPQGQ